MKTLITLVVALLISISSFAQQGINYKALIKDSSGNVLSNTYITVQFTIHQTTATGIIVYQEDHNYTTDSNGLIILNIGTDNSPIVGVFNDIDWSTDLHFLQTSITYSGGTIDFDATEFMSVPYAKHAKTADIADNVFSGDYNDLINQPTTTPTGLEKVTEETSPGSGVFRNGWRLVDANPLNYGPIGEEAVDLSISNEGESSTRGATGNYSVAMGGEATASGLRSSAIGNIVFATGDFSTAMGYEANASGLYSTAVGNIVFATGDYSTAMGHFTTASDDYSTAMGFSTVASGNSSTALGTNTRASGNFSTALGLNSSAKSYVSLSIGRYNIGDFTDNPGTSNDGDTSWIAEDPLFEIGNGTNSFNKSNALTVLKNGKVGIGRHQPSSLLEVAHQDGPPTSANRTNAFSIRNLGSGRSWQMYTESNGYLLLFNDGNYRGSFNAATGAYAQPSDRRLKKGITAIENGTLNKVMQLNPVSYLMKDQMDTKRNLGLISQEVQELFPSITHYVKESDILTLSYTELIPILIKALQEQQGIIESQKAKDVIQDQSIEDLVARLNFLESKSSN